MALRSGLDAQLGARQEAAYGTYLAPDHFYEFVSEGLKLNQQFRSAKSIRAATRVQRQDRQSTSKKGASGPITLEPVTKGFGLLLNNILGTVAITTPGGGVTSRLQTHTIGDLFGKSLTLQVGRPDVAGTVQPFSYVGAKFTSWELSQSLDDYLGFTVDVDAQDETTAQALAAKSYPASAVPFHDGQLAVTVAGSAFDSQSVSVRGETGLKTDRYFVRTDTKKKEQIPADMVALGGALQGEFESLTAYNRFVNSTIVAITYTWTGSLIEGALAYYLKVTLPACRFDGETPVVGGPGVLEQPLPFTVLDNGVDQPITIEYQSTDTAV
jgi:hypothetical protein